MGKWHKGTVNPDVRGKERSKTTIPCLLNHDRTLAVHRFGPKSPHWQVTHAASGLGVTGGLTFRSQAAAKAYADDLHALAPDKWAEAAPELSAIAERWRTELKPRHGGAHR